MIENLIHTLESLSIGVKVQDGDIKISAPKGILTNEIVNDIKTHKEQLISLLSSYEPIPSSIEKEYYNVTSSQRRLWTLSQFDEGSMAYNIFGAFELHGILDLDKLSLAFNHLINRHESLRTVFKENKSGDLGQYIIPIEEYSSILKLIDIGENITEEIIANHVKSFQKHIFDLENGPLFIGEIIRVSPDRYVLVFNMHHIIGDGWSMAVLKKEFMLIYNTLVSGNSLELPKLNIQYKDYSEWQNSKVQQENLKKSKLFWQDTFKGDLPILELPVQKARPKLKTYNGSNVRHSFSKAFTSQLNTYTQQNEVTLFMVLMAALNGLFSRYVNTGDIVLGTPVAGREHPDLEEQVGLYLNTLAIRTQFEKSTSFKELLAIQKSTLLDAYSHQNYPFDELVDELQLKRDISRSALFDIMVVFQNQQEVIDPEGLLFNEVQLVPYQNTEKSFSKFDITLVFSEQDSQLNLDLEFNTDIYEAVFIEKIALHLENFLQECIANSDKRITKINYLSELEEKQIIYDFNDTLIPYPSSKTIVDLFVEQAINTPDAIAITFEEKELTYKELDELSNQLANYLISNYDIEIEDLVGVKLDRSEWLIITLLAVLKTGGAYVPIDPNYPEQRIAYIEKDSKCKFTIDESLLESFGNSETLLKSLPKVKTKENHLAYVMYTSGSTGTPKGVLIEQQSIIRLVKSSNYYQFSPSDVLLTTGAFSFDATTFEYWGTLLNGSKLVICTKDVLLDSTLLNKQIKDATVNVMWFTSGWFNQLVDNDMGIFESLETVLVGGDKLSAGHISTIKEVFPNLELINGYGPTENTTFSLTHNITEVENEIPIGSPISNSTVYILNDDLQVQPIGVVGEICLGGDGLARGYLNDPNLTSDRFITHPFLNNNRLYKTGDLGRWLADGTVEFMGRKDDQVKIRGYRIEPGEIENVILRKKSIEQCVVIVDKVQGESAIISYLVSTETIDKKELRSDLSKELPDYMLPSYYVSLDKIPLTPNGKVDKKALSKIGKEDLIQKEYVAPKNELEEQLVSIWEDVLGAKGIGVTDNFFELGGHSLKVTLVCNKIKQILGLELGIKDMFLDPTITGIALRLQKNTQSDIPKAEEKENYPLTFSQKRLWILSQFEEGSIAYNIPGAYELEGVVAIGKLKKALIAIIERHESLRTVFLTDNHGDVRQYIKSIDEIDVIIDQKDLSNVIDQSFAVASIIENSNKHRFDLSEAPLLKLQLVTLSQRKHLLLFNMHHIISDGWSMEILSKEFAVIYGSLLNNKNIILPTLSLQYKDYAEWLTGELQQSKLQESKDFWLDKFKGDLPVVELPTYQSRPKIKTYKGNSLTYTFSKDFSHRLQVFSEKRGASLFMTVMAGINGLFSRYTGLSDIVLGTPIAGRNHPDLEGQIGLYLNTLAIRTQFQKSDSFDDLLEIQKSTLLDAYSHQDYPFDDLVNTLDLHRDTSRSALFDVMVVFQNQRGLLESDDSSIEGLTFNEYKNNHRKVSQFDISFIFSLKEDCLHLYLEYNTDLYKSSFIEKLFKHLEGFLNGCISKPLQSIQTIDYLTQSERTQLLDDFNTTEASFPENETIVDLFLGQVKKTPKATAVVYEEKEFTYQELDELSNELSHFLSKKYTLNLEDLIGVKLNRDEWLVVSLLAILKLGCAYVPIDPKYPKQRITYIEKDSNCKVIIDDNLLSTFKEEKNTSKEPVDVQISSSNVAYIIYTSGSTGIPKGVMIKHSNAVSMLNWSKLEFSSTNFEMLYAVTSHCFDLSVFEIFYPLTIGKKIRVIDNGLSITKYLSKDKQILINTVPSVVDSLLEHNILFDNIVGINMAGEPIPISLSNALLKYDVELRNLYGPSEDTTYSSCYRINKSHKQSLPIGKPISNTQFYILSNELLLQPIGVVGEICISGEGLSSGYLNKVELTNEKFVPNPYEPGELMYRTGDLGKWLANGTIGFIGRQDDQVKIRGHRIELGEIEHALTKEESVINSVVLTKDYKGEKNIVAYLVGDNLDQHKLRESLLEQLPIYMLPSYYKFLEEIPLTPNGKIDKKALLELEDLESSSQEYVAPRNKLEIELVEEWKDLLEIDQVGIRDNFFELGGHSLTVNALLNRINVNYKTVIKIEQFFSSPTIEFLSLHIENVQWQNEEVKQIEKKKIII
ncbi:amino acid adenylation domain-containing protein [Aquimarina sp. MMG015]|uniref:amino acid adenylation domain-containing protein n=1 Tax=Aquimarina sp. MMG015 TaxID=2822689 RepID=UPI0035304876